MQLNSTQKPKYLNLYIFYFSIFLQLYGKLASETELKLRLKNRGDGASISALKNGHLTLVKENGKFQPAPKNGPNLYSLTF